MEPLDLVLLGCGPQTKQGVRRTQSSVRRTELKKRTTDATTGTEGLTILSTSISPKINATHVFATAKPSSGSGYISRSMWKLRDSHTTQHVLQWQVFSVRTKVTFSDLPYQNYLFQLLSRSGSGRSSLKRYN
jgi:hypothetical protein